jgi:hypothetical protein
MYVPEPPRPRSAGEALASLRRGADIDAGVTVDAIVMASAARRGDVIFTSDVDDLERFSRKPFTSGVVLRS